MFRSRRRLAPQDRGAPRHRPEQARMLQAAPASSRARCEEVEDRLAVPRRLDVVESGIGATSMSSVSTRSMNSARDSGRAHWPGAALPKPPGRAVSCGLSSGPLVDQVHQQQQSRPARSPASPAGCRRLRRLGAETGPRRCRRCGRMRGSSRPARRSAGKKRLSSVARRAPRRQQDGPARQATAGRALRPPATGTRRERRAPAISRNGLSGGIV